MRAASSKELQQVSIQQTRISPMEITQQVETAQGMATTWTT
jgi:hypothetical protein